MGNITEEGVETLLEPEEGVKRWLCSDILQMETPFPIAKLTKAQKVNTTHKSQKPALAYRTHKAPSKTIKTMGRRGSLTIHTACQSRNSNAAALGSCRPGAEVFSVRWLPLSHPSPWK